MIASKKKYLFHFSTTTFIEAAVNGTLDELVNVWELKNVRKHRNTIGDHLHKMFEEKYNEQPMKQEPQGHETVTPNKAANIETEYRNYFKEMYQQANICEKFTLK